MTRLRPWVTAVLGLLFLVQGFAVAAAQLPSLESGQGAAEQAVTPCHQAMLDDSQGKSGGSCCNSGCPDMASCSLGHMAVAVAIPALAPVAPDAPITALVAEPISDTPQTLLRPPIAFRG